MANELYTRTNQRLFFAAQSIQAWQQACHSTALNALSLQQGACESALFHLHGALLALCQEIAGFYRLPGAGATHVSRLLQSEALAGKPCPELGLIAELAADENSWVASLRKAYAELSRPPLPEAGKPAGADDALIIAVPASADSQVLSPQLLGDWQQRLRELALHCRSGMSEW